MKRIESEFSNSIKSANQAIACTQSCLKQLKEYIVKNNFPSQEIEIEFFKKIKPTVYSHLIYYMHLIRIESERPTWCEKKQKKQIENELFKLDDFFTDNASIYQYIRNDMFHLDQHYFLRNGLNLNLQVETSYFDMDPQFSTSHDHKVALIKANLRLCKYLKNELAMIEKADKKIVDGIQLNWTESKISMIELIYALHASGSINNGNTDIKELAMLFETLFNIDLGDYYRVFLHIKNRHNQTKFMDTLRESLVRRIDQQDE